MIGTRLCCGVLGQACYLIVTIPDLCLLIYFDRQFKMYVRTIKYCIMKYSFNAWGILKSLVLMRGVGIQIKCM